MEPHGRQHGTDPWAEERQQIARRVDIAVGALRLFEVILDHLPPNETTLTTTLSDLAAWLAERLGKTVSQSTVRSWRDKIKGEGIIEVDRAMSPTGRPNRGDPEMRVKVRPFLAWRRPPESPAGSGRDTAARLVHGDTKRSPQRTLRFAPDLQVVSMEAGSAQTSAQTSAQIPAQIPAQRPATPAGPSVPSGQPQGHTPRAPLWFPSSSSCCSSSYGEEEERKKNANGVPGNRAAARQKAIDYLRTLFPGREGLLPDLDRILIARLGVLGKGDPEADEWISNAIRETMRQKRDHNRGGTLAFLKGVLALDAVARGWVTEGERRTWLARGLYGVPVPCWATARPKSPAPEEPTA